MSLGLHRMKRDLGGIVHLLTIDASTITGNPLHVRRFVNGWGEKGKGVTYQGNIFAPHPYELKKVTRSTKSSKQGATIKIADADLDFTRFMDEIGGSLENARIYEYKVYERFLDGGVEANINAYIKRLDHIVSYTSSTSQGNEVTVNTIDPLSRDIMVPTQQFSAGVPNDTKSHPNVFPAVNRAITKGR